MAYKLEKESTSKKAFYQISSDKISSDQLISEEIVEPQESSYVNVIKKVKKEN
jgi:hypothetical protein